MITKAGVPAHKVLVGVATYGRSLKIAESTCYGPDRTFEGTSDESPADKGGYLSLAEIDKILREDSTARTWIETSSGSNSNVMVYQYDEWVAYMDDNIRQTREGLAKRRNLGGTIEGAVDLQEFLDGGGVKPIPAEKCAWRKLVCTHPSLTGSGNKTRRWADSCATAAWEEALTGWKYNQSRNINPRLDVCPFHLQLLQPRRRDGLPSHERRERVHGQGAVLHRRQGPGSPRVVDDHELHRPAG